MTGPTGEREATAGAEPDRNAARDALDGAPSESPRRRAASITRSISAAAAGSGQRTGFASTAVSVTAFASIFASISWTLETQASLSTPNCVASSLRAMAPAAPRTIVSRAGAPAALPIGNSALRLVRVVRVRRPVDVLHVIVRLRRRVLVAHPDRDRRTERLALEDARQDLGAIRLVARRCEMALSGATPVEVALDLFERDRETRRAAVHHHAAAVRLARRW